MRPRHRRVAMVVLRRERERGDLIKRALGPAYALQQQMKALELPLKQFAALQTPEILAQAKLTSRLFSDQQTALQQLMNPQGLSAIGGAALALQRHDELVSKQLNALSLSFDSGILATAKALQDHKAVLAAAIAVPRWQTQLEAFAERISPSLLAFRSAAGRVLMTEMATLRAAAGDRPATTAQLIAGQAIEAHALAEALVQADTPWTMPVSSSPSSPCSPASLSGSRPIRSKSFAVSA